MKLFKRVLTVFIVLSLNAVVAADTIKKQKIITLNSAAEAPMTTESKDGFLDELAQELFRKIGYQLKLDKLPAERALRNANNGLIDGEIIRVEGINKFYPNLVPVSEKLMTMNFVAFSRKENALKGSWSGLAKKEVAYITGWKIYDIKVPKTSSITKTSDSKELFTLLGKDRVDFALYIRWGGHYMIDKLKIKNVHLQQPELAKKDMYMYLHKKHSALVPQLTAALVEMKKNGSYQKLVAKHLTPLTESRTP